MLTVRPDGDIFATHADALVNPVNTVGTSGAGLALAFRKRFPQNHAAYAEACRFGRCAIGRCFVWNTGLSNPTHVVNFPTKEHWRNPSELRYVEFGLANLRELVQRYRWPSLALPALGCGLGGLAWENVADLCRRYFEDMKCDVTVFAPR